MRILNRLHERIGDFWWYSLMIFCAARAADVVNVFVGLWLVPKCVSPDELGAVQPLTSFASFFAIPAGVFATTFRQEISSLATRREFGRMKSLMRGVFLVTAVFFFVALVLAKIVLPAYLERLRVVEGSLGLVILAASFAGPVSAIYTNPLQVLKKFRATSAISILGAPIRFATMLIAMPFRALAGYFVGQVSTPAFATATSLFALRKELAVPAEPYWSRDVFTRFGRLFALFGAGAVASGIASLVETTVIRQRLPEIDSAAYYIITRFSDMAGFVSGALCFTIFPYSAELAAQGRNTNVLVAKASAAIALSNAAIAVLLWAAGHSVLSILPHGEEYSSFAWALPWIVSLATLSSCTNLYCTAEMAANRFGYLAFMIPLNLLYAAALLFVTGFGYFRPWMPQAVTDFIEAHNVTSLHTMMMWMTVVALLRLAFCAYGAIASQRRPMPKSDRADRKSAGSGE